MLGRKETLASQSFVDMRVRNAGAILRAVRNRHGISRAELADYCELAKSTVSSIVDELVRCGILLECGAKTAQRGRRPVGLEFNSAARVTLGISLDFDSVEVCLCNLSGDVLGFDSVQYVPDAKFSDVDLIDEILQVSQSILVNNRLERWQIAALGVALPGPISEMGEVRVNGTILSVAAIRENLSKYVSRTAPVLFDTNTNSAAMAESRLGAARKSPLALVVRLGAEVRSAFLRDGELISGVYGRGGDLGHLTVPGCTVQCKCGKLGCINAVASFDAIVGSARRAGLSVDRIDDVIVMALEECQPAVEILEAAAGAVGFGIASASVLMAPADVVVTGKLVTAAELIVRPLKKSLQEYSFAPNLQNCSIHFSEDALHAEATGAALAALAGYDFWDRLLESALGPQSEARVCGVGFVQGKRE